ncbi:hypothetical protein ACIQTZ_08170 [Paenarthrobacter sp. NPDC090520]|uniref:hypothetical protein n=1 Tax=Paenarthrobacter sp. NPDC090520 TaxID=3364382 RepID=UPI0037FECEE4
MSAQQRGQLSLDAQLQIKALESAYRTNADRPVAYLDETSMPAGVYEGSDPFYAVTAVVVPPSDHEGIRKDLLATVGASYWHSTKANETEEGKEKLDELARYIGEGAEPVIISARGLVDPADKNAEKARFECLTHLLSQLNQGSVCDPVNLFVLERRQDQKRRNIDDFTFKSARKSGAIALTAETLQVSPTHEHLLWLPDIVSYAYYRKMAVKQPSLFDHIEHMVTHISPA